jgi:redox-sensitive bicupin YhaK (pirin superfamily)
MIERRPSNQRGQANHGWLRSQHTFSFGGYHDPRHMGFGHLRVINEDHVEPGRGFGTHGHQNMEILSYVVEGALAHRDSTGEGGVIRPGEVQVMSAGAGIRHSELNHSASEPVHFLQIWLLPSMSNTEPGYRQALFEPVDGTTLLVSPDGREGSLTIRQDVEIYRLLLPPDGAAELPVRRNRSWVQVVRGSLTVNGTVLQAGDGAGITASTALSFHAEAAVEALVFDLL